MCHRNHYAGKAATRQGMGKDVLPSKVKGRRSDTKSKRYGLGERASEVSKMGHDIKV